MKTKIKSELLAEADELTKRLRHNYSREASELLLRWDEVMLELCRIGINEGESRPELVRKYGDSTYDIAIGVSRPIYTRKEPQMKTTGKYNGWTNYETWRVNLEIFDGLCSDMDDEKATAEGCKEYADEVVSESGEGYALDYARAFLANVNWHEIADHLNEL